MTRVSPHCALKLGFPRCALKLGAQAAFKKATLDRESWIQKMLQAVRAPEVTTLSTHSTHAPQVLTHSPHAQEVATHSAHAPEVATHATTANSV